MLYRQLVNVQYTSAPGEHRKERRDIYRRIETHLLGDSVVIHILFVQIIL